MPRALRLRKMEIQGMVVNTRNAHDNACPTALPASLLHTIARQLQKLCRICACRPASAEGCDAKRRQQLLLLVFNLEIAKCSMDHKVLTTYAAIGPQSLRGLPSGFSIQQQQQQGPQNRSTSNRIPLSSKMGMIPHVQAHILCSTYR